MESIIRHRPTPDPEHPERRILRLAFTGYRPQKMPFGFNEQDARCIDFKNRLRNTIESFIWQGYRHFIYAGADALLVPSRFEPCGLTQLIAMHYGDIPIVRETGGLKDTVEPYNEFTNWGNGFTFDRYESGLLLDAINRAKTLYFTNRWCWDEMVQRNMDKDVSWESSARQYRDLYVDLTR